MILVGPRPHPLDDFARYEVDHFARLDVTPGMTGLWQVTARQDPSFRTTLGLDLEYIQKWSLWLDLQILFKTLSVVVTGTGVLGENLIHWCALKRLTFSSDLPFRPVVWGCDIFGESFS